MTHPSFVALAAQLRSCVSFLADVYSILFHSILFYARWRAPFILTETRGKRRRELTANTTKLEGALADAFAGSGTYY